MSTNVVVIGGRLTRDADLKNFKGYDLATFTVAFDVGWGDRKHAVFVDCKWWGRGATAIAKYLVKGKAVVITGSWDCEKWKDNQGMDRRKDLILVNEVELGSGGQMNEGADRPQDSLAPESAFDEDSLVF